MLFDDIVRLRDEAFAWVRASLGPGAICGYRLSGGGHGDVDTWQVAGFFCEREDSSRQVFEALYIRNVSTCVLRVYRDQPLTFLSTAVLRSWATEHLTAADVFCSAVSNEILADVVSADWKARQSLDSTSVKQSGAIFYPIPPPLGPDVVFFDEPDMAG
jgi:hypothetical protein